MDPSRSFVCIGQSHAKNFIRAARRQRRPVKAFVSRPAHEGFKVAAPEDIDPAMARELAQGPVVLSCIGGNSHNSMVLLRYPRSFDFILSEKPGLPLDESADYLTERALRMSLSIRIMAHMPLLVAARKAATGPVFHSESPPPPPDTDQFRASVAARVDREPAPAILRYKMWRLHSAIVREVCEKHDVTFLERPEEAVDAEGFLKPDYFHNATHANQAYARLVWRDLDARL